MVRNGAITEVSAALCRHCDNAQDILNLLALVCAQMIHRSVMLSHLAAHDIVQAFEETIESRVAQLGAQR